MPFAPDDESVPVAGRIATLLLSMQRETEVELDAAAVIASRATMVGRSTPQRSASAAEWGWNVS